MCASLTRAGSPFISNEKRILLSGGRCEPLTQDIGRYIAGVSASRASRPVGYNYDTFAADPHELITQLGLKDFTLVGFSMGGGEIARYFGQYGSNGASKAVIIGGVPPFLQKTQDNPEGVDARVFEEIQKAVAADRYAFFTEFFKTSTTQDVLLGKRVS
jgi:non-heme chloroperoxidase